jgi:hypothetical protein
MALTFAAVGALIDTGKCWRHIIRRSGWTSFFPPSVALFSPRSARFSVNSSPFAFVSVSICLFLRALLVPFVDVFASFAVHYCVLSRVPHSP